LKDDKKYWLTPPELYQELDQEFHFDYDPCPYPRPENFNGIEIPWGMSNYVNPPFRKSDGVFGAGPTAFIRKSIEEQQKGKSSVIIINTMAFINMLLGAGAECRPMGRVRWLDCKTGKPWGSPSSTTLFVLRGKEGTMKNTDPEIIKRLSSIIYIRKDILEKVKQHQRKRGIDESEAIEELIAAGYEYIGL